MTPDSGKPTGLQDDLAADDSNEDPTAELPTAEVPTVEVPNAEVPVSEDRTGDDRTETSRRRRALPVLLAAVVGLLGVGVVLSRGEDTPPPKPDIPLDAWVPYWTLDASTPVATRRLGSMREVSPFWFNATGVDSIETDPNASDENIEEFMDIARSSGAAVVPSIVDATPAGTMASILLEPEMRERHVEAIVSFAADGDFDGIDLDYEQFAFADGRETWATTRPAWVAFVEELSERLAENGRTLTVSIPYVYDAERTDDSGFWVYDYGAISQHVDRIRIMAYDFSVGDPGPIAPLDFVRRAVDGAIEATGAPEKLVLGVPAYGRNWPTGTTGDCAGVDVEGMTSVNARTVDDLIERRDASPRFDAETGEWRFTYELAIDGTDCVQQRVVHYVDGDGVRLRMDIARERQLDGVSLWAFGFDDDAVWSEILPTVTESSPR